MSYGVMHATGDRTASSERETQIGRPRLRCEKKMKMDFRETLKEWLKLA